MAEEKKIRFSRQSVIEKQEKALEESNEKIAKKRQMLDRVGKTPDGEQFLRYLFLLSGGDRKTILRDKEQKIDIKDTLLTIGAKSVWEDLRWDLTSDMIKKIERHLWEDK